MPENPAFIGELNSNHATRQDPADSYSVRTNIREKDDIGHSLDNQGHQDRQRSDTASLMIILSETSSRLSNSISKVSKSLKSPASDSGKAKDWSRLKLPENSSSKRYLGLLLAFISGVMMTTYSSMIKMLDTMDSMQVVVIRGSLQFFIMGSIAMYKNVPFKGDLELVPIKLNIYFILERHWQQTSCDATFHCCFHRRSPNFLHLHEFFPITPGGHHHHPLLQPSDRDGALHVHPSRAVRDLQDGSGHYPSWWRYTHFKASIHLWSGREPWVRRSRWDIPWNLSTISFIFPVLYWQSRKIFFVLQK